MGEPSQAQTARLCSATNIAMESIVVAKGTAVVVLGGVAFLVTLAPVFLDKLFRSSKFSNNSSCTDYVLSLLLSFGGGVLLCTTFIHLLPEVSENLEALRKSGKISEEFPLPMAELIVCCGFFVMYIIEEITHKFLHGRRPETLNEGRSNSPKPSRPQAELSMTEAYKGALKHDLLTVSYSQSYEEDIQIFSKNAIKDYGSGEVNHNHCDHYDHDHQHHELSDHHHHLDHQHGVKDEPPSLRELLLVLALTVHESFEGLAIGLESAAGAVWYLLIAVAVHKCVIAFCIGVELVCGKVSLPVSFFYAFIYSVASPIGIVAGYLLTAPDDNSTLLLSAGLQGLATGTLLYVVFFEVLRRDGHGRSGFSQLLAVLTGFALMTVLVVLLDA